MAKLDNLLHGPSTLESEPSSVICLSTSSSVVMNGHSQRVAIISGRASRAACIPLKAQAKEALRSQHLILLQRKELADA